MTQPRIALITTGGTVAARQSADGAVPVLSASELLAQARTPSAVTPVIETNDLMSADSSAITVTQQAQVVRAVTATLADPDVTGVVVTHGTDTMEETAFLADLVSDDPRPIVFTGAQYPADTPEADGPANIAAAIEVAADPDSRGRGVVLALGGRVLPVRGAFKVSTTATEAFDTVHAALPRPLVVDALPERLARVDTYALYPGVAAGIIAAAVAQRASGIVLAATGSGNTHPDITAEVVAARRAGVAVVVTTRVPYGPVVATYGGGGGAVDLERAGAVVSRWLRAPQARMALIALLSTGHDADDVADFFRRSEPAA